MRVHHPGDVAHVIDGRVVAGGDTFEVAEPLTPGLRRALERGLLREVPARKPKPKPAAKAAPQPEE